MTSSPYVTSFTDLVDCLYGKSEIINNEYISEKLIVYGNYSGNTLEKPNCFEPIKYMDLKLRLQKYSTFMQSI